MPVASPSRSLLVKPVSGDCNLQCHYCFYHDRASDPYRQQHRHLMDPAVLETLVRQGMALDRRHATFGWQGGEPTLAGLDFYRAVVELQQRHGSSGQAVSNGMQTNGLLLDAEWAAFLRRYSFLVGLSLDGPAPLHDAYRTTRGGEPTQERVLRALRLLSQYGVEYNVLTVVNRLTALHGPAIYTYLRDLGVRYMQFIPCVERDPSSGQVSEFSVEPERFGDFLCAMFDRWYAGGQPEVSVRDFDSFLAVYLGEGASLCSYQARCGSYLVVEHNGDVYPCDFYVTGEMRLGNLVTDGLERLFASEALSRFAGAKAVPRPECQGCAWNWLCQQGCPRFVGLVGPRHYLCRAYQRFFAHSHAGFVALRDRLLAVRDALPTSSSDVGRAPQRNDPCPCGSGRKYKQCCARRTYAGDPQRDRTEGKRTAIER